MSRDLPEDPTAATQRGPDDFPPFPELPSVPQERLSLWLGSVRVLPLSAAEWQGEHGFHQPLRALNHSMWFWFQEGSGKGRTDGTPFRIGAGDLMLISQGVAHTVRLDRGPVHFFPIHFHVHTLGGIDLLALLGFPSHLPAEPEAPYGSASQKLAREFAVGAPGWQQAVSADILSVILHIVRHHGAQFRPPNRENRQAELPRLLPALELIDRRLSDHNLTVGDLAKEIFVSEVYLRKLFRGATGLSPVAFVQRRRIQHACALLRGGGLSIKEIAEASGFSSVPFFHRVFRRWTQTTPGRYRESEDF